MRNFFYTTLRPAMYHGHGKRAPFFEGWYYKLVSVDEQHRYAVIPGVILGEDGHTFIQVQMALLENPATTAGRWRSFGLPIGILRCVLSQIALPWIASI
jgi:hypothetical protein